jgi:hypothetical protein
MRVALDYWVLAICGSKLTSCIQRMYLTTIPTSQSINGNIRLEVESLVPQTNLYHSGPNYTGLPNNTLACS